MCRNTTISTGKAIPFSDMRQRHLMHMCNIQFPRASAQDKYTYHPKIVQQHTNHTRMFNSLTLRQESVRPDRQNCPRRIKKPPPLAACQANGNGAGRGKRPSTPLMSPASPAYRENMAARTDIRHVPCMEKSERHPEIHADRRPRLETEDASRY